MLVSFSDLHADGCLWGEQVLECDLWPSLSPGTEPGVAERSLLAGGDRPGFSSVLPYSSYMASLKLGR